jgi:hypothetical protein
MLALRDSDLSPWILAMNLEATDNCYIKIRCLFYMDVCSVNLLWTFLLIGGIWYRFFEWLLPIV